MFLIILGIIYFLYYVRVILLPFVLAILLVYLINPLIEKLIEKGQPRLGALIFIFGILIALLSFTVVSILPTIVNELDSLSHNLPTYMEQIQIEADRLNQKYERIKLPPIVTTILDKSSKKFEEVTLKVIEQTSRAILGLLSRLFSLIMAPILAFYLLKDLVDIEELFWSLIPKDNRPGVRNLLTRIDKALFGFFKGQLIVSVLVGILSIIGLRILKIKFYLIIGIFVGIFNIVPYFGPVLGALPAVIIAGLSSTKSALLVSLLFLIIQQVEGSLLSPKIMSEEVGLHPVIVIFALLAGGELLGIIGMLLAVPVAAIIKEILYYTFYEVLISVDNR